MSGLFARMVKDDNVRVLEDANATNAENIHLDDVVVYENFSFQRSNKTASIKKIERDWKNLHTQLSEITDEDALTINNCPSMKLALSSIRLFIQEFFIKIENSLHLRIRIDEAELALDEHQTYELVPHLKSLRKSFIILFESIADNSCIIYWKLNGRHQILKVRIEKNGCKVGKFISEFIMRSLRNDHNALHSAIKFPDNRLICDITLDMLRNHHNRNLLFQAAPNARIEIVKFLINYFDVNQEVDGKLAIDLAYAAKNYTTTHFLLRENSKFPTDFDEDVEDFPFALRKFLITSKSMHDSIISRDGGAVSFILQQNQHLKYFFNTKNESALAVALNERAFDIYKILIDKNISLGPHESFEDIMDTYSLPERRELSKINIRNSQSLKENYILKLLANSNVGLDDKLKETRFAHVVKAFECLNKIEEIKILLKFTAAMENFQLVFDFNRDHVQFLDPKSEAYVSGLFYLNGRILIGAKHLLNDERAHEVYGVIAHEICHFVMFKTFENYAKPYENDSKQAHVFQRISDYCRVLQDYEEIVALVFNEYDEDQQHAELIVRIPHLLGHYHDDPEKLKEVKENLSELYRFYIEHCIPNIVSRLEGHDKKETSEEVVEMDEAGQSTVQLTKNFTLKHWKRLLICLVALIVILLISVLLFQYYTSDDIDKASMDEHQQNITTSTTEEPTTKEAIFVFPTD